MPNVIDANGLEVATQAELVEDYTAAFESIYGSDIDLSSSSPDGQMMMIFIQSVLDLQDLLVQVYNMFDPDNAVGVILDQRVALNGIQRQAGTYTTTNISITVSQALNLYGLDQEDQPIYTVADSAGVEWQLLTTQNIAMAGTAAYEFRAAEPGAVQSAINTITVPVTIVLGVTTINNPTTYTTLGINEETDAVLKVRRQRSVSLASQGYLEGLLAALENINGVTSAFVYENTSNVTDGDGVPAHSIWVIVAGSATDEEIAEAIYTKRNAGCGMFGDESYVITQVDGSPFTIFWDNVEAQNIFIAFTATSIDGENEPDIASIRAGLVESFDPGVYEEVDITSLGTAVQALDSNCLVTSAGFSLALSQVATLSGVAASGTFVVDYNGNSSAAINWNDAIGVIQSKVQAVTGLSAALVTGSIASQTLTFDLSALGSAAGLVTVSSNSLATGGAVAITFSFAEGYTNTLTPTAKNNQFAVAAANIIILPMILSPSTTTVASGEEQQFTGLGGYGDYVYSFQTNNSGGTIDASTGLYEAGGVGSVTDTVKVTDAFGNTATATITVT